jgi:aminoglycoside phosphotransferase family enzyme/predicted kinase
MAAVPDAQIELIRSLSAVLEEQGHQFQLFETHLSWVLVTGDFAYKVKKAVQFDFVDYSTLAARHLYCCEELRLNRRIAPQLYMDLVTISGAPHRPIVGGPGPAIEYAVRMRAFSQQSLWSRRVESGLVQGEEGNALALKIAGFHQAASIAPLESDWGSGATLRAVAIANFAALRAFIDDPGSARDVARLWDWLTDQHDKLRTTLEERKARGFIRECHGDLHLGNILTWDGEVTAFDCIEFNESLRWIDVMNDIAFLYMDLRFHKRRDLAMRVLNRYLAATGDYEGVAVLGYYEIQRAVTRCKVALLRIRGSGTEPTDTREAMDYLAYAVDGISVRKAAIMITHGYSGSGKSFFSTRAMELTGAIQLRSDIERKRITRTADLYSAHSTRQTYQRLCDLAGRLVRSGWPVIVDAAFLKSEQRRQFEKLAGDLGVPFFIFDIRARESVIKRRIAAREKEGHDPSDAGVDVLARQLKDSEPLVADEIAHIIPVDLESEPETALICRICEPVLKVLCS